MTQQDLEKISFLFGDNAVFIEELYQLYLLNPSKVDRSWRSFFEEYSGEKAFVKQCTAHVIDTKDVIDTKENKSISKQNLSADNAEIHNISQMKQYNEGGAKCIDNTRALTEEVMFKNGTWYNALYAKQMISAYRERGHYLAKLDPLDMEILKTKSDLKLGLADFGMNQSDPKDLSNLSDLSGLRNLSELSEINILFANKEHFSIQELTQTLERIYASSIGVECAHVQDSIEKDWLYSKIEQYDKDHISLDKKRQFLENTLKVEIFEHYLHTKFTGAKRFSVEGSDSVISALNEIVELSGHFGVDEIVFGMAHRGRLCTLSQVIGKPYRAIFSEFMGNSAFPKEIAKNIGISGDVKYHMGYSSDIKTKSGASMHLSLMPNPSHLEAINPVCAGKVRAKQDLKKDIDRKNTLGMLIHGDAAFCGQGVVAESLMMSTLKPYDIGGVIHIVINNQIGFTANPKDTRSGRYPTDFAKSIDAPIFHVNGDDVESVLYVTQIAVEYRQRFGKDVVIDVFSYRKYGHNEGDEPMYTQGVMYNIIKNKISPGGIYANQLVEAGSITLKDVEDIRTKFKNHLDNEYELAQTYVPHAQYMEKLWQGYSFNTSSDPINTSVSKEILLDLLSKLCTIPDNVDINHKLHKLFKTRLEDAKKDGLIDWATGEQLAFATLLNEGIPIRITGQDCGRGTFSHRHSVLHSQSKDEQYIPLNHISSSQAEYFVADSNLSEYGVLGFEYGYSTVSPSNLVIWEAQFGDFANGAQIIFDQFISSAQTKWLRASGIVVLLPHASEGQGPEHSSARLERFLQLAAEDNMQIVYPTTPASFFHLIRRQIHSNYRKPLIVMSPKSLLRHKLVVSNLEDLSSAQGFLTILDEVDSKILKDKVKRIVLCSGKVYYDLLEHRDKNNIQDIALIRIEQLYPFPHEKLVQILKNYSVASELIWCQEEHQNMGAWNFIRSYLEEVCHLLHKHNFSIKYIGRHSAASPAVGYLGEHNKQQLKILTDALNLGI